MDEYGEHIGVYLAEVVWWAVRPAWHLLFSGAFERHPELNSSSPKPPRTGLRT